VATVLGLPGNASSPTRFVILATQRTGSTWLADMLDSHPRIESYEELFLPAKDRRRTWGRSEWEFFHAYYARRAGRRWPAARAVYGMRYLEELYAPRPATEAVGMKLMYSQLKADPWLLAYLVLRRVRVLHLVRTNLLDVVISQETAKARRQYHAVASDAVEQPAVYLNPEQLGPDLESLQRSIDRIRLLLRGLPVPSIEISYEDLTRDENAVGAALRFLDVAQEPLASRFVKLNRRPRQELIANYGEVEAVLSGTRFERFLAD
jgi:LPS sulfotransferase NodH